MKISIEKLKAILVYFANNTETKYLGKTKLMKLFYFLDFTHLKRYGAPVTYDRYVHLEHGPIPQSIKNLIDTASDDIDSSVLADTISFEKPIGIDMSRIIVNRKFSQNDEKYFSETELEVLDFVCSKFKDKNTKFIEDESHCEAPWRETSMLEDIPYNLATMDPDCLVSKEDIDFWESVVK